MSLIRNSLNFILENDLSQNISYVKLFHKSKNNICQLFLEHANCEFTNLQSGQNMVQYLPNKIYCLKNVQLVNLATGQVRSVFNVHIQSKLLQRTPVVVIKTIFFFF